LYLVLAWNGVRKEAELQDTLLRAEGLLVA